MQCGVRDMRRQEVVRKVVKYFGYGKEGHKKWECLRKRKKRKREEEVLPCKVWDKMKEHSGAKELPPRGAAMCMEGWTTSREVVTFVEYRECNYKGTKTKENREQGFLQKGQLCNMWCGNCKKVWNWKNKEAESRRAERVKCNIYRGKDTVIWETKRNEKGEIFCLPCRTGKKTL